MERDPSISTRPELGKKVPPADGYSWSLGPLLHWLKVLGVHLPVGRRVSLGLKLPLALCAFCWFSLNVSSNVAFLIHRRFNGTQSVYATSTVAWARRIYYGNKAIHDFAVHLLFFAVTQRKWRVLWNAMERLEAKMRFRPDFYRRCRRLSLAGSLYAIVYGLLGCGLLNYHLSRLNRAALHVTLLSYTTQIGDLFSSSILVLFCLLAWTLVSSLTAVTRDVDRFSLKVKQLHLVSKRGVDAQVDVWRSQFAAVVDCVHHLNQGFGPILLIHTWFIFVFVIIRSFFLVLRFINEDYLDYVRLSEMSAKLFHLLVLCTVSGRIGHQATEVGRALNALHCHLPFHHPPINQTVIEIRHTGLEISAAGFFHVNRTLILQLLSTFLTYFIILYQFQTSEEKGLLDE